MKASISRTLRLELTNHEVEELYDYLFAFLAGDIGLKEPSQFLIEITNSFKEFLHPADHK